MTINNILKEKGQGVSTVGGKMPVDEAIRTMRQHGTGVLVVSEDGRAIEGLLNSHDLIRAFKTHGVDPSMPKTVADIMRRPIVTCRPEESLRRVMTRMAARGLGHIPVVDDTGLRAVVSLADIVSGRLKRAEEDAAALRNNVVLPV